MIAIFFGNLGNGFFRVAVPSRRRPGGGTQRAARRRWRQRHQHLERHRTAIGDRARVACAGGRRSGAGRAGRHADPGQRRPAGARVVERQPQHVLPDADRRHPAGRAVHGAAGAVLHAAGPGRRAAGCVRVRREQPDRGRGRERQRWRRGGHPGRGEQHDPGPAAPADLRPGQRGQHRREHDGLARGLAERG